MSTQIPEDSAASRSGTDPANRDLSGRYLTFRRAHQDYGVQILKVREIIGLLEISKVPRMPTFVRGVISLRGKVIPVIDLPRKFALDHAEDTNNTCVIIVDVEAGRGLPGGSMGILVDTVGGVVDITDGQVEPPPTLGSDIDMNFILAMARTKDGVKNLLDIERVLSAQELSALMASQEREPR